jgi:hypothetical protein
MTALKDPGTWRRTVFKKVLDDFNLSPEIFSRKIANFSYNTRITS